MNARGFPSTLYVTTYSHVGETGFPYFPACQGVSSPYLLAYYSTPLVPRTWSRDRAHVLAPRARIIPSRPPFLPLRWDPF